MKFNKSVVIIFSIVCWFLIYYCNVNKNPLRQKKDIEIKINEFKEKIEKVKKKDDTSKKTQFTLSELYFSLGNAYTEKQSWNPAIESYEKSISYGKESASVFYSLGLSYANRGKTTNSISDFDAAIDRYLKAKQINPRFYEADYARAIVLFFHKTKQEEALVIMENVVSTHKTYYPARFALARFYYELQRPDKARIIYEDLYSDLEKLPESQGINEYKKLCKENIIKIISEIKYKKN